MHISDLEISYLLTMYRSCWLDESSKVRDGTKNIDNYDVCGYMSLGGDLSTVNFITLDFETYYDRQYSLRKLTTEEYVRDERFEVIGLAIKGDRPILIEGAARVRVSYQKQTSLGALSSAQHDV